MVVPFDVIYPGRRMVLVEFIVNQIQRPSVGHSGATAGELPFLVIKFNIGWSTCTLSFLFYIMWLIISMNKQEGKFSETYAQARFRVESPGHLWRREGLIGTFASESPLLAGFMICCQHYIIFGTIWHHIFSQEPQHEGLISRQVSECNELDIFVPMSSDRPFVWRSPFLVGALIAFRSKFLQSTCLIVLLQPETDFWICWVHRNSRRL